MPGRPGTAIEAEAPGGNEVSEATAAVGGEATGDGVMIEATAAAVSSSSWGMQVDAMHP